MVERKTAAVVVGERRKHDGIVGMSGRRDSYGVGLKSRGGHSVISFLPWHPAS